MKKISIILSTVLLSVGVWAQSPQKMSYQAVIRNADNQLVANKTVGMRISILQGTEDGTSVYTESQSPITNSNGLISIVFGTEVGFDTINWANGPYFIKTETDPNGGKDYTITGVSQLLSVPYALHSNTANVATYAEKVTSIPTLSIGQSYQGGIIFWLDDTRQHGLIAAVEDQDAEIWYNGYYSTTNTVREGIGAGMYNTECIIVNQGAGIYAAQICASYQGGGYGDWYLPSGYELNLLFLQKDVVGGFAKQNYWSSNEVDGYFALAQAFNIDYQYQFQYSKSYIGFVRAVRSF